MVDIGHIASLVQTPLQPTVVTASDTDFPVVSTAGFVVPCAVLVGHADAWHDPTISYAPELVWITSVPSGTILRCTLPDRGISGTSVRSHNGSAQDLVVTQVFDQRNWQRLRDELAGTAKTVMGTYVGNGTTQDIPLPFTPGSVQVSWVGDGVARTAWSGAAVGAGVRGLYADGSSIFAPNIDSARPRLLTGGFRVASSGSAGGLNHPGVIYTHTSMGA